MRKSPVKARKYPQKYANQDFWPTLIFQDLEDSIISEKLKVYLQNLHVRGQNYNCHTKQELHIVMNSALYNMCLPTALF